MRSYGKEGALYRSIIINNTASFFGANIANFPAMLVLDYNYTLNYDNKTFVFTNHTPGHDPWAYTVVRLADENGTLMYATDNTSYITI